MRRQPVLVGVGVFMPVGLSFSQGGEQAPATQAGPQYTNEDKLLPNRDLCGCIPRYDVRRAASDGGRTW